MFESLSSSIDRRETPLPRRQRGVILLLLCLGAIFSHSVSVEAAVDPPFPIPPKIVMSNSPDFSEMIFVVYVINSDDPWGNGNRVDPASVKIVPANGGAELPLDKQYAVLAVPRALAEKTKGAPDAAWLEPSAPGVVRVPGTFRVPYVFRQVVLSYQLDKADKGPKLTLLNPEDLKTAQHQPQYGPDRTAEIPKSAGDSKSQQSFLWGLLAGGGGILVLVGGVWFFSQSRRTSQPPARDNPS